MTDLTTKLDEWQRIAEGAKQHNGLDVTVGRFFATFSPDRVLRMLAVVRAAQEADKLLAGMWSYNEEGRSRMKNTYFVQASEAIRAALAALTKGKP